jgi:DNA-directed RNA polymerase sigma subunit (sigma70/sigma32)
LEKYFGVNGRDKMTLEQISDEIGVTKERVRQLKERGLEWIRQRVEQMGITMD